MWDLREQSSMTRSGDFKHCKRFKLFRPPRIVTIVEQTFLCQRQSGNEGISTIEEYFVINWISLNRNVSRQSVSPRQQRQDPGTQTPDSLQEDRRRRWGQQEDKRQVWSSRQVQVSQPELLQCPQQSQGLGNWSIYTQNCSGRQRGHSEPKVCWTGHWLPLYVLLCNSRSALRNLQSLNSPVYSVGLSCFSFFIWPHVTGMLAW